MTGPHQPNARAHGQDLDLFGDPEPPPQRGGIGYLAWLAELAYPDGYRFWSLANTARPKHLPAETTEMVWLVNQSGEWLSTAVDITDGHILQDQQQKANSP